MYNILSNAVKKLDVEIIDALIERNHLSSGINWSLGDVQIADLYITPYIMKQVGYLRVILVSLGVLTLRGYADEIYPIENQREYNDFLKYFFHDYNPTCKGILEKYYYPYEENIRLFLESNIIELEKITNIANLHIYRSTAPDNYLGLPILMGDLNKLEIHWSLLPNLTIVQYPQPVNTDNSLVHSAERLIRLACSNAKVVLAGCKEWMYRFFRTTLDLSYSSLTLEEDYSGSDPEAYSTVTNTLLNDSMLMSQYPNNYNPTAGISYATDNSRERASVPEALLYKSGLVVLHVLNNVYEQKIQKIKGVLEQMPGGFLPICIKPVSQVELEASLSEMEAIDISKPYCILSSVRLTSTGSKLTSLDKKSGVTVQLEKRWKYSSPNILTGYWYRNEHIESIKEFKSLSQRYEVLVQNLESVLISEEYVLYIIGSTGEFDYVRGVTGVPDMMSEDCLSVLKRDVDIFKGSTDFSYTTEF